MSKRPRNDTSPAEFSDRRRLRSGRSFPSAVNLPPSRRRARARVSSRSTFASDDNTAVAVAENADPEYLVFLQNLRVDGSCYAFEMPAADESADPMRLKYEDDGSHYRTPPLPPRQEQRKRASKTNEMSDREPEKRQRAVSASATCDVKCISSSSREAEEEIPMYDGDYKMFLDRLTLRDDGSMVVQWENGVIVVFEEKNDDEVVVINDDKSAEGNIACITEIDLVSCDGSSLQPPPTHSDIKHLMEILRARSSSTFNNRLMSVLEKPFDKKEYKELMVMATRKKPVTRLKHLREDSVPYETNIIGCSYLDHYPDLAKQIHSTDNATALFLLRGFFFWLKNIGHVGAYMPWLATSMSATSNDSKNAHNVCAKFPKHEL